MGIRQGGFMAFTLPARDRSVDDASDFRMPSQDGVTGYNGRGMLGNFAPTPDSYPSPRDVKRFEGCGATAADLERGYVVPVIREEPAFDKSAYQDRWTMPRVSNEDTGQTDVSQDDWEFRGRNQRSRGFLTRPRIPTERG